MGKLFANGGRFAYTRAELELGCAGLKTFLKYFGLGLITLGLAVGYALAAIALSFHIGQAAAIGIGLLGAVLALVFLTSRQRVRPLAAALIPLSAFLIWWSSITPSNDRVWMPEVAETLTAEIDGSQVTLHNVRNFTWRSQNDFDPRWESRRYDLDMLETVDVALSYWGLDKIAHVLVSFGFSDGERIMFSVEIRKELGEAYSELGGLFKQFELSLIAATEEDVLYLRTNARDPKEDVYLYPLKVDAVSRKALFLSYAGLGNRLAEEPYWYNTITANCTSVIYRLVRSFNPDRQFDLRFILSGGLPEYLVEQGMLAWDAPLGDYRARAAISAKARAMQPGQSYSEVIRAD